MSVVNVRKVLIGVNAALLLALAGMSAWPAGASQPGAAVPGRDRGQYTMVTGRMATGSGDAVYIVDAVNRELVALRWDNSRRALVGVGYRNLDADGATAPTR